MKGNPMSAQGDGIPRTCIDCGKPVHTFGFRCGPCFTAERARRSRHDYVRTKTPEKEDER